LVKIQIAREEDEQRLRARDFAPPPFLTPARVRASRDLLPVGRKFQVGICPGVRLVEDVRSVGDTQGDN
jgi:hypothetical protein